MKDHREEQKASELEIANKLQKAIAKRFDELCTENGMSHYDLAVNSEVPYATVKRMFSGTNRFTYVHIIARLIRAFEIDLATFFDAPDFRGFEPDL